MFFINPERGECTSGLSALWREVYYTKTSAEAIIVSTVERSKQQFHIQNPLYNARHFVQTGDRVFFHQIANKTQQISGKYYTLYYKATCGLRRSCRRYS